MKTAWCTLTVLMSLTLGAGVANAGWTHTTTFRYARSTSLRVVEPNGFKVKVNQRNDTVPAVFNLPNANDYVWVAITAKDGQSWRQKIEVRANQETVLKVSYTAEKKAPAKKQAAKRSYVGSLSNTSHRCRPPFLVRFDFMKDGKKVRSETVTPGRRRNNIELPEGAYDIRIYKGKGRRFFFKKTLKKSIDRDGWKAGYGC